MSLTRLVGIAMIALICLPITGATAATTEQGVATIFVDGMRVTTLDTSGARDNTPLAIVDKVPAKQRWKMIMVDSEGNKRAFFRRWQRYYGGCDLLLGAEGKQLTAKITNCRREHRIPDMRAIHIFSADYTPPPADDGPVFRIHYLQREAEVTKSLLSGQGGARHRQEHGWPATWVIRRLYPGVSYTSLELHCDSREKPMNVKAAEADRLYIKLNRNNRWRAVATGNGQGGKRDWMRCKGLESIHLR